MTKIFFSRELNSQFLSTLAQELEKNFHGCKRIAIKMHFGEFGNMTALKPKDIAPITKILGDLGREFFLFDSSVAYPGPRSNKITHKLLALSKGFRKVITDDAHIIVAGKYASYEVCKLLAEADAVLVLSHIKGHECTGFGGAIKNLGMGALTKKSKSLIHDGGKPLFGSGCIKCGVCIEHCPIDGMRMGKDHPEIISCYGCSNCHYVCPCHVITPKLAPFDVLLADGANAAQSKFKKYYYVSFIKNITKKCDCVPNPGEIINNDIGYMMGSDAVAIDQAVYNIVVEESGEIFLKHNLKTGLHQIMAAENLNMGKREFELVRI
jgi:uncharacterized Fe-S center protein